MNGLRNVDEVTQELAQTYSGPLKQVRGYSYIPWNETAKALDEVYGPWGWQARIVSTHNDTQNGIYRTDLELTVTVVSDKGALLTKTVPGTGVGIIAGDHANAHDTAIKGSASDALSRAAKLLGVRFGLSLYDKEETPAQTPAPRASNNGARQGTSNPAGRLGEATEKQVYYLRKAGLTDQQITAMSRQEVREHMDQIMSGKAPVVAASANMTAAGTGDDFPF